MDQKIPNVDIFEDTEISYILRRHAKPKILNFESKTSSVRFQKNGFIKQSIINQYLKVLYHLKFSKKKMNRLYEKGLDLNKKE